MTHEPKLTADTLTQLKPMTHEPKQTADTLTQLKPMTHEPKLTGDTLIAETLIKLSRVSRALFTSFDERSERFTCCTAM